MSVLKVGFEGNAIGLMITSFSGRSAVKTTTINGSKTISAKNVRTIYVNVIEDVDLIFMN